MVKLVILSGSAVAAFAIVVSFSGVEPSGAAREPKATNAEGTRVLSRLPAAFVPNVGQWQHPAHYVVRVESMSVFLEPTGWTFTLAEKARGVAVRMTLAGAGATELVAEERLPGCHNYFLGSDPAQWRSDVPLYRSVRYREVQRGVDVRARECGGHFEYDLLLQPEADLDPVEFTVEGIERMRLDGNALVLETKLGPVRMAAPPSWEEGPSGERSPISCRYVIRGDDRFGFEARGRRAGWALIVDPGLDWSTFLGGGLRDQAFALVVDPQGATTVAGHTASIGFPTTLGAFDTSLAGISDAFVTRLTPTGSGLVYSTFLGGADTDAATALALDAQGAATVAGQTGSTDFPTTLGAFDRSHNGGLEDGFVTRLSPSGSSVVWSTFLGGASHDQPEAVALDTKGAAVVTGLTHSDDFPTTPSSYDTEHDGRSDAFVTKLSPSGGSLVYSTFFGGTGVDSAHALALDAQGAAVVVGQLETGGSYAAFVIRLPPDGSALLRQRLLGGGSTTVAHAVVLDPQGVAIVAGVTFGNGFQTTPGAFDTSHNGNGDAFVARILPSGSVGYATFLGGSGRFDDRALAVAIDARGSITVAGRTGSADFPTTAGAFSTMHSGIVDDAFVTRFSPDGSRLEYSTFLGGSRDDVGLAIALDTVGAVTLAGWTGSSGFPTTPGAFDTTYNGGDRDAFVTRLDMLPAGVVAFGRSSPGCTGPLASSVTAMPRIGNASFALTCGNAPAASPGILALAASRLGTPFLWLGVEVWLDPLGTFVAVAASSDTRGGCETAIPIPNQTGLIGQTVDAQFIWAGPSGPPPCPPLGISASNALEITIQA